MNRCVAWLTAYLVFIDESAATTKMPAFTGGHFAAFAPVMPLRKYFLTGLERHRNRDHD